MLHNELASPIFVKIIAAIDHINAMDPNSELVDGQRVAKELIYGQRMSECLNAYWPKASEYLHIAVRAQHIKRWHLKRSEFAQGRAGYLQWRKSLGVFHAQLTHELMLEQGYQQDEADKTAAIIRKEKLKSNPDSQTLEDVACLVFLQHYFAPFAAKHTDEKVIRILQKTWRKMSEQARGIALSFSLPKPLAELVEKALS